MTKTVVGLYEHRNEARSTVQDLVESGIRREEISLLAHDPTGEHARSFGVDVHDVGEQDAKVDGENPETATGASIGAAAGGIAGLLAGIGMLMIPGIGPVLAAGPIVAVLGGMGIGAVAGGIIGALVEAGVPEEEASLFAESVRSGNILVVVETDDALADRVAAIMNRHHPIDLEQRFTEGRGPKWQGFNEDVEPFAFDKRRQSYKERQPSSRIDYGPGARAYLRGQPVAAADRAFTELGNYNNEGTSEWKTYESRFRADYERHYARSGRRWEDYREAYRFGFDVAQREPYANSTWDQIQAALRENWDTRNIGMDWAEYEHAIRQGWEVGHVPH